MSKYVISPGQFSGQYEARTPGGTRVGFLAVRNWEEMPTPEVGQIDVNKRQRRKGIARDLVNRALEDYPNLSHSRRALTEEGARFALSTPLPGDDDAVRNLAQSKLEG